MEIAKITTSHWSSFARRFVEGCLTAGKPIAARDFYAPYVADLLSILRANGVELYNTDLSTYTTDQNVIDDILTQLQYEEERFGQRAKTYETLAHDVVLWHFVSSQRTIHSESPLEVGFWIVTVDYRFLGFDAFKRRGHPSEIPVCLLPSSFIQLLQFWIPRTPRLEEMLFDSWAWPLFFSEFDPQAEAVTMRILQTLSRFEDMADLPPEAVGPILLDTALRQKILLQTDAEQEVVLVRDALVRQHKKLVAEIQVAQAEIQDAKEAAAALEKEVDHGSQVVERQRQLVSEQTRQIATQNTQLQRYEQELHLLRERRAKSNKTEFVLGFLAVPLLVILLLGAGLGWFLARIIALPFLLTTSSLWLLLILPWLWLIDRHGMRNATLAAWTPFKKLHKFKVVIFAISIFVLLAILGAAVGDIVWSWIKEVVFKTP